MKKRFCHLAILIVLWLAWANNSFSQPLANDSTAKPDPYNDAVTLFTSTLGTQAILYNGPQYSLYDPYIKGTAFFQDINTFVNKGDVLYDGVWFRGIPLMLDLVKGQVVSLLSNRFSTYYLLNMKVSEFIFVNHHFINLNADTITNNTAKIRSGYYDRLYDGKVTVLVRQSKSIQETPGGVEKYFSFSRYMYVKKGNTYYDIDNQSDLLRVLKDKRKELQKYIKANQIKFRRTPEEAMVKISSYYDQLTN